MTDNQKQYTRDLKNICTEKKNIAVFGYRANTAGIIKRLLYAKAVSEIDITVLNEPKHDDYDMAIVVSDYDFDDLPKELQSVSHGIFLTQAMADIDLPSKIELDKTDWTVIRELERKFLSGTELNIKREQLRSEIDTELKGKFNI